jgi:hypothetical protein
LRRKVGVLRAGIEATLRVRLGRRAPGANEITAALRSQVEEGLRLAAGAFDTVRRVVDALGDFRDADADAAIRQAAAALVDVPKADDSSHPPAGVVRDALAAASNQSARQVIRAFGTLTEDSRRALGTAARALGLPEPATDGEWASLLRELPQLDVGTLAIARRLPLLRALGRRVAVARVSRALRTQVGWQITQGLKAHAQLLRVWGNRVLTRLRELFEAQAQIYRVQLAGTPATGAENANVAAALREVETLSAAGGSGL